jgi:hypothetical protein
MLKAKQNFSTTFSGYLPTRVPVDDDPISSNGDRFPKCEIAQFTQSRDFSNWNCEAVPKVAGMMTELASMARGNPGS